MKATIEVPDELYRRVKAKSALEGRAVREVAVDLFRGYVGDRALAPGGTDQPPAPGTAVGAGKQPPPWFGLARRYMRRKVEDHTLEGIGHSIEKGWSAEVAEREAALRPGRRR